MSINSKIQWTDHTINFWIGCIKLSPGCRNCYMYRDQTRYGNNPAKVVQVSKKTIDKILKDAKAGDMIFTCSWSDFFLEEADAWRQEAWDIIRSRPDLHWQILTKRPERIKECLPSDWGEEGYANVWLGVSVENQDYIDRAVELFQLSTRTRKWKTFISYEPAIGPLDLEAELTEGEFAELDWVILGGESGNETGKFRYRECKLEWFEKIVLQCKAHNIPVFVKQLGTYLYKELKLTDRVGGNIDEFPDNLKIREFPQ